MSTPFTVPAGGSADSGQRVVWVGREVTEGTIANRFWQMRTVAAPSFEPNKVYITPQEYGAGLVSEYAAAEAASHNTFDITFGLRPIDIGWFGLSMWGAPTIVKNGGTTGTTTTLTFSGTWAAGDKVRITVDGYETADIDVGGATPVKANFQTAVALLPSVKSCGDAAANLLLTLVGSVFTFNFTGGTTHVALANMKHTVSARTIACVGNGTLAVANPTTGTGSYTATYALGSVGKPTLSIIEFDGLNFKKYLGASVNTWEITRGVTDYMKVNVKGVCKTEVDMGQTPGAVQLPNLVSYGYVEPFAPAQYVNGINYNNSTYSLSKGGKFSGNNNRVPVFAEGLASVDAIRMAERFVTMELSLTARNTGYTGSAYAHFLSATDPLNLTITAADGTTTLPGATSPTVKIDCQNPRWVKGKRNTGQPETEIELSGKALYDQTSGTPATITVTSDEPFFGDIAA